MMTRDLGSIIGVLDTVAAVEQENIDVITELDSARQLVQHSQAILLVQVIDRLDQIIRLLGEGT